MGSKQGWWPPGTGTERHCQTPCQPCHQQHGAQGGQRGSPERMASRAGDNVPISSVPTVPHVSLPAKSTFPLLPSLGYQPALPSALGWHWWSGKAKGRRPRQQHFLCLRDTQKRGFPIPPPLLQGRAAACAALMPPTETPPPGMPQARQKPHRSTPTSTLPGWQHPGKSLRCQQPGHRGWMQSLALGWHHPGEAAGTEPGKHRHSCAGKGVWHSLHGSACE